MASERARVVAALGVAQTVGWASTYYLPAILAVPMARELGIGAPVVFAAFSVALGGSALVGPWSGRAIDRYGGRPVLVGTSLLFAAGLAALGCVRETWGLFAAWGLMGIAMGAGLYEAAFSTVVRLYGTGSRSMITGITLIGGFASTVGWPLSAWMEARYGWRGACFGWAAIHLAVGLPLNAWLPRAHAGVDAQARGVDAPADGGTPDRARPATRATAHERLTMALLAFVFASTWFTATAMATHFPRLLQDAGASLAVAVGVGALIGPAQVAARLLDYGLLRRLHPLLSARLASLGHPVGAAALLLGGPALAPAFAILHGGGNGMMTIAKGTLPLVLFGSVGYGARQGWLMVPSRIAQALAPFLFGVALDRWGASALWGTCALAVASVIALAAMRADASDAAGARGAPAP